MRGAISGGKLTRSGVRALSAAGAAIALAGCGSAAAGGSSLVAQGQSPPAVTKAAAGAPLCADARKVDQVTARLTAVRAREILPRTMTITDASQVRALATALCGLPRMPRGVRRCPMALPGALQLVFRAGGRAYRPVLIRDSGCASVTGIGPARQWTWSSRAGRLVSTAAGSHGRLTPGTYPSSVPIG
jgi:hypothetical protein